MCLDVVLTPAGGHSQSHVLTKSLSITWFVVLYYLSELSIVYMSKADSETDVPPSMSHSLMTLSVPPVANRFELVLNRTALIPSS